MGEANLRCQSSLSCAVIGSKPLGMSIVAPQYIQGHYGKQ